MAYLRFVVVCVLLGAAALFSACHRSGVAPPGPRDAGTDAAPIVDVDAAVDADDPAFLLTVVDERSRAPIADAAVQLVSMDGRFLDAARSDSAGQARFPGPAEGPFTLEVDAADYALHTLYGIPAPSWTVGLARPVDLELDATVRSDASAALEMRPSGDRRRRPGRSE